MIPINYAQLLQLALPEVIVVATALIVMALDLLFLRNRPARTRFTVAAVLASLACAAAIVRILLAPAPANILDGTLIANPLIHLLQIALLALTILALLISVDSTFTQHVGEFVLLILMATAGMMFLVASQDLLVIFISLELLSLSLYTLAAFSKRSLQSWEAAIKYYLFGGMSAAFLLLGFSLLYGFSNSTSLPAIAAAIHGPALNPFLAIAIVTTAIGLGFKIAAAPFHFWAPDVYQGAPAPTAAFIASASKVASFFIFFQIVAIGFAGAAGTATIPHLIRGWIPVLALMAAASMLLGNLVAIRQTSLRRLLAYSAIAHAGYMLLAIVAHTQQSLAALLYYVFTYALATLGAFAVIAVVETQKGSDQISHFDGLSRQAPVLSFSLAIFVLSLAGIPPLAGFFGKFYLFVTVLGSTPRTADLLWLVALAIAMSAVSLYYYLRVLKAMYVAPPTAGAKEFHSPILSQILALVLAAAVILLGCAPNLLLHWIQSAIAASGL
ncbi:MAG: NADH-quinone oxidoreductase subunit N [Acidobacteriaceae bacterium]|jgi:NADH-quinone oxidoreductase subunit N